MQKKDYKFNLLKGPILNESDNYIEENERRNSKLFLISSISLRGVFIIIILLLFFLILFLLILYKAL